MASKKISWSDPDPHFDPGTGLSQASPRFGVRLTANAIAVQKDGKIVVGGNFTQVNGQSRNGIARLNGDGSHDTGFNPGRGVTDAVFSGQVWAVAIQTDGKILIGGVFTNFNGTVRNRIAGLDSDGSLDASFDPGSGASSSQQILSQISALALQSDGKILVGGRFTSFNGVPRNHLARLNNNGTVDSSFDPGAGLTGDSLTGAFSLVLQTDGKIVVGGRFTTINGLPRGSIGRFNSNGSVDTNFVVTANLRATNSYVFSLAIQNDQRIVMGGLFSQVNGITRNGIARLYGDAGDEPFSFSIQYVVKGSSIALSWPLSAVGFNLESTDDLGRQSWTAVPNVLNNSVTVSANSGSTFYRLRR